MKYLIRTFAFNVFALWLTSQIIPALSIHGPLQLILMAGIVLSLLTLIVKPVLKILFIPINIITFGLMSWSINVVVLYLLTLIIPEVSVSSWVFPGLAYAGFSVPSVKLTYLMSFIVVSLTVTFIANVLHDASDN
jgi:putative membrane protein